jgi:hypothetical protein
MVEEQGELALSLCFRGERVMLSHPSRSPGRTTATRGEGGAPMNLHP